jgi:hypothetical protein
LTPITIPKEPAMAKGQQKSTKEAKKPKKDSAPPKPMAPGFEPIRATVTTAILPRGKAKNKPA